MKSPPIHSAVPTYGAPAFVENARHRLSVSPRDPIDTRQIFPPGDLAVDILHEGTRYTLRLTRANKLILTK